MTSLKNSTLDRRSFLGRSALAVTGMILGNAWRRPASAATSPGPIVRTTSGRIRGVVTDKVHVFKGLSYGAPTSGPARFMPPTAPKPWTDVRDALTLGERCPQGRDAMFQLLPELERPEPEGEDCLRLNVWTNGVGGRGQKRPVMIWVHGGGYSTGSGGFLVYDGYELARKHDVVVVTINHRLNIFGFLHLADLGPAKYAQSTNLGMRDIVLALEWVRDNIEAFGGDPKSITLFGQSGGAGKIGTLMAMPSARGLFHRAIVQSGAAITGVSRSDAAATTQAVLTRLGLNADHIDDLQRLPAAQLLAVATSGGRGGGAAIRLAPVVDGAVLPTHPFDPIAPALSADVPLLIGTTETEVLFFQPPPPDSLDDDGLRARVKQSARLDDTGADRVIAVYRRGRPNATNADLAAIIATDVSNRTGPDTAAERKAAQGKAPVYKYYFSWYSPVRKGEGTLRAFHTLEIPFVFDHVDRAVPMTGSGADRQALADRMSRAWVAFARTGNPQHKALPPWRPFTNDTKTTMLFGTECRAVDDPYREERLALSAARAAQASRTSIGAATNV